MVSKQESPRSLLQKGASRLDLHLSAKVVDTLLDYHEELVRWNRRINLVAHETEERRIVELHFLDSLTLLHMLPKRGGMDPVHLLDVGSGAGFPGLALAVAAPDFFFTLVEPRQKRASFLRHIIRSLHLDNVELIPCRLEEQLGLWPAGRFSHITSRALAEPAVFLPMVRPLLDETTVVLLMLARRHGLSDPMFSSSSPWQMVAEKQLRLPFSTSTRLLVALGYTYTAGV